VSAAGNDSPELAAIEPMTLGSLLDPRARPVFFRALRGYAGDAAALARAMPRLVWVTGAKDAVADRERSGVAALAGSGEFSFPWLEVETAGHRELMTDEAVVSGTHNAIRRCVECCRLRDYDSLRRGWPGAWIGSGAHPS
jgi:hypothetical protein